MAPDIPSANDTLLQVACRLSRIGGWKFSLADRTVQWSDEVCSIHELPPGSSPSLHQMLDYFHADSRPTLREAFAACLASGTPYDIEALVVTALGNAIWVRTLGQAVRDVSGSVTHVQGAFQDISDKRRAELAERDMADRLSTTLESITDAFFTLDHNWRFTYLNEQAARVLLRPRAELLGKELLAEFKEATGSTFETEFRRAATQRCAVSFEEFYAPLEKWVEVRIYPINDGLAVYFSDVSERRLVQQALEESEARFKTMARATSDVIWDWNLKTDQVWRRNESVLQLCGVVPEKNDAANFWLDRIHPADRKRVMAGIQAALLGEGTSWSDEYRFLRHDGSHAFVMDRASVIRDARGTAVRVVGAVTDLSERRQLELERDRLHKEKSLLLESAGEGFFGIDNQGSCTFINAAAARMLGYAADEVIGKPIHALVRHGKAEGEPYSPELCKIWNTLTTGQPCRDDTEIFWRKDGSFFPVGCASYPILDDGKAVGVVVTFSDITERHDAKLEIVRINRGLQMLRRGSETLLKATSEQQLLMDICRVAVEVGGYPLPVCTGKTRGRGASCPGWHRHRTSASAGCLGRALRTQG